MKKLFLLVASFGLLAASFGRNSINYSNELKVTSNDFISQLANDNDFKAYIKDYGAFMDKLISTKSFNLFSRFVNKTNSESELNTLLANLGMKSLDNLEQFCKQPIGKLEKVQKKFPEIFKTSKEDVLAAIRLAINKNPEIKPSHTDGDCLLGLMGASTVCFSGCSAYSGDDYWYCYDICMSAVLSWYSGCMMTVDY